MASRLVYIVVTDKDLARFPDYNRGNRVSYGTCKKLKIHYVPTELLDFTLKKHRINKKKTFGTQDWKIKKNCNGGDKK